MTPTSDRYGCDAESVSLYAVGALPAIEASTVKAHIASCAYCRDEFEVLRWVVDSFASGQRDLLRPSESVWQRLEDRIVQDADERPPPSKPRSWPEPEWEDVAPGISCKILATDNKTDRIAMLVRLGPGVDYPPHTHADVEELYLLWGDLWIDNRKLRPGDYNRAESGTADKRVWSETGCTCVLMTSAQDRLS